MCIGRVWAAAVTWGILATAPLASVAGAAMPGAVGAAAGSPPTRSCVVAPDGVASCYPSVQAMFARAGQLTRAGSGSCPLTLYSGADYSGQALEILAQGYWVELSDYGFDDATVSFAGTGCGFHLAQGDYGSGYWFPGFTGPWGASANMGPGWDYTISSVYIDNS